MFFSEWLMPTSLTAINSHLIYDYFYCPHEYTCRRLRVNTYQWCKWYNSWECAQSYFFCLFYHFSQGFEKSSPFIHTLVPLERAWTLGKATPLMSFSLLTDGNFIFVSLWIAAHPTFAPYQPESPSWQSLEGLISYQTKANCAAGHPWATWQTRQGRE